MKISVFVVAFILLWTIPVGAVYNPALVQLQENISQAVASIRPAAVSVKAQKKQQGHTGQANGPIWYESIGSGIVIDQRGFVLTNYHVVNNAENVQVSFWRSRNRDFPAKIVAADESLDLAVLKISGNERFPVALLGDSDGLETGDYVICVGNPFGFNHSVSLGIVSDLHRQMTIEGISYKNMIQTDAVINEGNSGGPMIDVYGKVVGVSTAIYAPNGTYVGLGFAIPINRAKHFFTRVTGAVITAAATAPVVQNGDKEPLNLNKTMPNDAIHQKFSDCLKCHTIAQKMIVSTKADMPHRPVGACTACHILTKDKTGVRGPVTVAFADPLPPGVPQGQVFSAFLATTVLKVIPIILVASIALSMIGVGGGFVYVPVLLSCGIDFNTAATTSLIMLTCAQLAALYNFWKSRLVDMRVVMALETPTMIGAVFGGMLAQYFNVNALTVLFSCLLFVTSYFMMQDRFMAQGSRDMGTSLQISPWQWCHEFNGRMIRIDLVLAAPIVFVVGYLGGMLGFAGAWLKIPIMVLMFNMPLKMAVACSSLMVPLTGLAGFVGHSFSGHCDIRLVAPLSIITMIGGFIGSQMSVGTESSQLRFIFAFVLSFVGLWMIVRVF